MLHWQPNHTFYDRKMSIVSHFTICWKCLMFQQQNTTEFLQIYPLRFERKITFFRYLIGKSTRSRQDNPQKNFLSATKQQN